MIKLADLKAKHPKWFSRGNKRFFGDVNYWIIHSKSGKPYLLRATYQWSDMFGEPKKLYYRINKIEEDLSIGKMFDNMFTTRESAKEFIKGL